MALQIQLRNPPAGLPGEWIFNGMTFLDVDQSSTATRLNRARSERSEGGKIKAEAAFPISLLRTEKNTYLLQKYIRIPVLDQKYEPIPIIAIEGHMSLKFDTLVIQGVDDSQNSLVGQLVKSDEFWAKAARELYLKDIPGDSFTFTVANIEAQWGQVRWNESSDPDFNFAPIHWGRPPDLSDNYLYQPEFLRPLHNVRAVLDKGFCELGYKFRSSVFESNYASQIWCYILAKDFYDYENKGVGSFDFRASDTGAGWDDSTPPNFDSAGNHANGRYDNLSGGEIVMGFQINVSEWQNTLGTDQTFEIRLRVLDEDQVFVEGTEQVFQFFVLNGDTFDGTHQFEPVTLKPGWGAGPTFWVVDYSVDPPTELQIFNIADTVFQSYFIGSKHIFQGDTIDPWTMINPGYTFYQFCQGVQELGNFLWWENPLNREVWLLPKYPADIFGTTVEGYLDGGQLDYRENKIIHKSRKGVFPTEQKKRFITFQFKDSTDGYIDTLDFNDDFPIYSRTVDFEVGINDREVRANSFFEPTADILWNAITIPAMWDSNGSKVVGEGSASFDIKPRILYAVGLRKQVVPESENLDNSTLAQWNWNGDPEQKDLPYYSQDPSRPTAGDGLTLYPQESVVYGFKVYDLYTMFLKRNTILERRMSTEEFLFLMTSADYGFITFRDYLLLRYDGADFLCEPIEIRDFQPGSDMGNGSPTPLKVNPVPQLSVVPECVPPSALKTCTFSMPEDSSWMISATGAGDTISCSVDAVVVNGTNILGLLPNRFIVNSGNIAVSSLGGFDVVTNWVDELQSAGLPFFTFTAVASPSGKCGGGMQITWPEIWNWELRFNFNHQTADHFADGMVIKSDGETIAVISEVPQIPDCGASYAENRWNGAEDCTP